jgi:hypothetical protein
LRLFVPKTPPASYDCAPRLLRRRALAALLRAATLALPVFLIASCSRFQKLTHDSVYVSARQQYLHDRVAAVSNRVGMVTNGEKLEVLERGKRFLKVKTPRGEIGWLEEHAVIDDKLFTQFDDQQKKHAQDPVVAKGQLRDDRYLHLQPGRETAHFLLIPANTKVQLLVRGSVPKAPAPGMASGMASSTSSVAKPQSKPAGTPGTAKAAPAPVKTPAVPAPAPQLPVVPVAMEDWWLVRDAAGHTGWLLSGQLDVDVPDEVGQYSEGQRMVAAYPLAKVIDDGSGRITAHEAKKSGKGSAARVPEALPDPAVGGRREITEFVTVLSPPRNGLAYDFDQVRVFTWSLNHHRYETGYRLRGIQGYLPVKIGQETVNGTSFPTFTFDIANGLDVKIDPESGITRPASVRTISFRLEGNIIRRTGADQGPIIPNHDPTAPKTPSAKKKRR